MDTLSEDLQSSIDCVEDKQDQATNRKNLLDAIRSGNEEGAILQLESGVLPVSDDPKVTVEESPIHLACHKGLVNFVKAVHNQELLLNSLAVYGHGKKITPFYIAMVAYYDQMMCPNEEAKEKVPDMKLTSVITYLLDVGADPKIPISVRTFENGVLKTTLTINSALHIACTEFSNITMVTSLISHGSDINKTNSKGHTPLMTALYTIEEAENIQEYLQLLDKLLTAGADPNISAANSTSKRKSPLQKCLEKDTRVMALLLKHGADVNKTDTEWDVAIIKQLASYPSYNSHYEQREKLELVLDQSYNINIHQIYRKKNFFHILCGGTLDNPEIVSAMLHKQPRLLMYINGPDSEDVLPLFRAVESFNLQIAIALAKHGALVNVQDEYCGKSLIERALEEIIEEMDYTSSQANTQASQQALKYLPEFVETMFNMGLMSNVYYHFIWEPSRWEIYHSHILFSRLPGLLQMLNMLISEYPFKAKSPEQAVMRTKTILDLFHSDDLLLHRKSKWYEEAREFDSIITTLTSDDIYSQELDDYISILLDIHQDPVPFLKRLCRMEIRVNISTKYGMERKSAFDLRDLCTELPIPDKLQQYLMVKVP